MSSEHLFLCNGAALGRAAKEWSSAHTEELRVGENGNVRMEIPTLAKSLGANVPDVFANLAEIAALVYAADQAVSRSGTVAFDYGDRWIRRFRFEIAVRVPDFWNQPAVCDCLINALGFLTEDEYEFRFSRNSTPAPFDRFLGFGNLNDEGIEKVLLFSGGVDSLAGAVEEVLHNGRKAALVSHWPVAHLGTRQDALAKCIADRAANSKRPMHCKALANKIGQFDHEHTQRSRSFLFASIAAVVARIFGIDGIDFYENGVVSVNLPLCEQEKNARASRTTHPQALRRLQDLLGFVAGRPFPVNNHYVLLTKQDIVDRIKTLGHADLLAKSISCTHTRGFTLEKPHCGLCSQCMSRRFATAGAKLDEHDPDSMYRTDVFVGERLHTEQRTLAERFVGFARQIEKMIDQREFQQIYAHELGRLTPYMAGSSREVVGAMFDLHHRHAVQVGQVVEDRMKRHAAEFRTGTLPATSTLAFAFALAHRESPSRDVGYASAEAEDTSLRNQVRLLTARQRCMVQALFEKNVVDPDLDDLPSQKTIAEWSGYPFDTQLKSDLTTLVKMEFFGNGKHHGRRGGYFLKPRGIKASGLILNSTGHD